MKQTEQIIWNEKTKTLTIDDLPLSFSVLKAIATTQERALFRFMRQNNQIIAIKYTEADVVFFEPGVAVPQETKESTS